MKIITKLKDPHPLISPIKKILMIPIPSKYFFLIQDYHSYDGKLLRDTGMVGDLWFDIVDGKKVYNKWAGVN
jgi:hypothetical protein